jgi:phage anti-repressor protein
MNNQQLIPIFTGEISGSTVKFADARALHTFLEVGRDFSSWIKKRIDEYKFAKDIDYIEVFTKSGENLQGGRPQLDYHLTLDMAKELCMVERNQKGRQARRYFIECEKKLHSANPIPISMDNPFDGLDAALLRQLGRIGRGLPWAYLISKGVTPELVLRLLTANSVAMPFTQPDLFKEAA